MPLRERCQQELKKFPGLQTRMEEETLCGGKQLTGERQNSSLTKRKQESQRRRRQKAVKPGERPKDARLLEA
jgi:hypothetical protein